MGSITDKLLGVDMARPPEPSSPPPRSPAPATGSTTDRLLGRTASPAPAPASEPAPTTDQSRLSGAIDAFTNAATFGLGDELTALESAILGKDPDTGSWFNYDQSFGERYGSALEAERQQQEEFAEARPYTATAATLAGAVATPAGVLKAAPAMGAAGRVATRVATPAATRGGQIFQAGALGGATGAAYGFGEGEGGVAERAANAVPSAGYGVAGGLAGRELGIAADRLLRRVVRIPAMFDGQRITERGREALRRAGIDPDQISDNFARAFAQRVRQAGSETDEAARLAVADEFAIPLTRGQATGDVSQSAFEEAARNAARGARAQSVVSGIDTQARRRVGENIDEMAARFGGGGAGASYLDEAGDVAEGVARAADRQRGVYQEAYRVADEAGAVVTPEAFESLPRLAREALEERTLASTAAGQNAVKIVERFSDRIAQQGDAVGVKFQAIEGLRKRLNRSLGSLDPTSKAEVGEVINALDEWTDDIVDRALISGSDEALDAVKNARKEFSAFKRLFTKGKAKGGMSDDAGGIIERMANRNVTPSEAANMLLGATRVGGTGASVRTARRLKQILDPEEWGALRGGAWRRVTQAPEGKTYGPQAIANRLKNFTDGEGAALARELFEPEELAQMRRFGKALDILVPPKEATNPSKTSYGIARMGADMWDAFTTAMGFATGGVAGGLGTKLANEGARQVTQTATSRSIPAARARVDRAVRGRAGPAGAVIGGGMAARED